MQVRWRGIWITTLSLASAACTAGPPEPVAVDAEAHRAEVEAFHRARVGELEAPDSWLSLTGLHWLSPGETTLGSAPDSDIVLPEGKAEPRVGTLLLEGDSVWFWPAEGVRVTVGVDSTLNLPAGSGPIPPDTSGDPVVREAVELTARPAPGHFTVLRHGPINWIIIHRDGRAAVRLRDNTADTYQAFDGIDRYPVDTAWHVTARWVPHDKTVGVPNVLGTVAETNSPAFLEFWVDGERYTLDVTGDDAAERYMLVFADSTSGVETYGGGRYLWVDAPDEDGRVVVDFNLAYNPPCVWSDYATCPLPTRENRLALPVVAGEKDWAH